MRSYLYVPGDQPDKLAKAAERGADAIIIDLEDGVAPEAKDRARREASLWLTGRKTGERPAVWVRVNHDDRMADDVMAVIAPGLSGICLPKVDTPERVEALDEVLQAAEREIGMTRATLGVVPLIETPGGLLDAKAIAGAGRVRHLALGEADLCASLGVDPSPDHRELWSIRTQIVVVSAAAAIGPPTGPISTDFKDLDAFRASTEALRRMGFGARAAIHPTQVAVINEVFTPSDEQVAAARKLLDRYEEQGGGVLLDDDGRMVDEAVVRAARRTLASASAVYVPRTGG